jgi:DNA invertase Pin-like site-specific DNA recombinase
MMDVVTAEHWALVALAVDFGTRHGRSALATFAPYERRLLGERTREALAARKAAGVRLGRRRAVPEHIVARITAERQAGASLSSIARGLNGDGISGSGGGRWYASTVRYLLMGASAGRPRGPART